MTGISYSPFCKYCIGVDTMTPGKSMVYCGLDDSWHNVTTGNCFGKCEKQEVIDGTEPAKWIEPKWGYGRDETHGAEQRTCIP